VSCGSAGTNLRRNLYLIGMPGSGKTTLGRALGKALGLPFADLDEYIVAKAGMSIPSIFAEAGEPAFRALERQALQAVALEPEAQVVATGGGVVLNPANVDTMRGSGILLWIDRPLEHILGNLQPGTRPLLDGDAAERLRTLHAQRHSLYREAAHLRLHNDRRLEEALSEALALLESI
jgi:shikimate kinase